MTAVHLTPRKFLGREIKLARERRALRPEQFATAMNVSLSLVYMWERGERIPVPEDLTKIESYFGFSDPTKDSPDPGYLTRIRDDMINDAMPQEWFGKWLEAERASKFIWSFEPLVLPGLLQTEEYMRRTFEAHGYIGAEVDRHVATRLGRQELLTRDSPVTLVALMDTAVPERCVGDDGIMQRQMEHLYEMAQRRNVIVAFLPLSDSVCSGFSGAFAIANLSSGGEVAYVDNQLNGEVVESPEAISHLRNSFETFRAAALNRSESLTVIEKAIDRWKS
ncbi:helix-turn-helix transcriptional regulator [Actinocorallia sp. A-T 12471]|uniref:helix-turn-helix domain-containing protein n=1 Tax=Actinocorallia sp. A-T 12471 TaxID=3089813 RepID=UPI0029CED8B7|nr:helix-turn-helix transcriptional regulator [Actinocorallia sp. A-T 12471]MDX6744134.1 helix-turn-helix transcriptional regulator [Actinocorallia sp. A-T 12471]